jgi:hypothetical protein
MKTSKAQQISISMLAAILAVKAAPLLNPHLPVIVKPSSYPTCATLAVPLINHNNGQFWSTAVEVEGTPSTGIDTALDTGGGQFIIPSSSAPPCQNGGCSRGTCK